ncbi:uroporphyrinogen-III C-methyltransferase [Phreatobacter stygius]|uniref:uroporphyrinogen-III C-methyltransferase n=1 Tax=Phreatobacter stygius TaxID=1940610 RepID=A0A4D7B492_9HYPH|nr:uroporphyrinogen-III C-methyltransferase [Phreatobacter stygius]QCI68284.1 uroporphyrinogen-III C-methyltransferase [Phreatobacter stygius]
MTPSSFLPVFEPGTVWLVGAGPGDPGLLTLTAVHAIGQADVILHDALIDPRILTYARPGAILENAGKRGHRPSPKQSEISDMLVDHARQGRRVLRLKGGDPFVFGRGYEEALALAKAGIGFRIVPGVSSGLATLALHGIPATSRDSNHAVILATGHLAEDKTVDWATLARTGQPLVLYMAVANLTPITTALQAGGLAADTPAIAVHRATTGAEEVITTTLAALPGLAAAGRIHSPAVIAIGAIAPLRAAIAPYLAGVGEAVR